MNMYVCICVCVYIIYMQDHNDANPLDPLLPQSLAARRRSVRTIYVYIYSYVCMCICVCNIYMQDNNDANPLDPPPCRAQRRVDGQFALYIYIYIFVCMYVHMCMCNIYMQDNNDANPLDPPPLQSSAARRRSVRTTRPPTGSLTPTRKRPSSSEPSPCRLFRRSLFIRRCARKNSEAVLGV